MEPQTLLAGVGGKAQRLNSLCKKESGRVGSIYYLFLFLYFFSYTRLLSYLHAPRHRSQAEVEKDVGKVGGWDAAACE